MEDVNKVCQISPTHMITVTHLISEQPLGWNPKVNPIATMTFLDNFQKKQKSWQLLQNKFITKIFWKSCKSWFFGMYTNLPPTHFQKFSYFESYYKVIGINQRTTVPQARCFPLFRKNIPVTFYFRKLQSYTHSLYV